MRSSAAVTLAFAVMFAGCSSSSSSPSSSPLAVTQSIGPDGGQILVDGATVTFAKGAVGSAQSITITASSDAAPDGFVALSRIYKCEPSGLNFTAPVTMQMQFTPDGSAASMVWSSAASPAFNELADATASGSTMTATIAHFSSGFVGRKK